MTEDGMDVDKSDGDLSQQVGGVTQAIRAKLNFTDDRKWRRFSARRLELIDTLGLSTRKASEQYNMIVNVADELRKEYGFPDENLDDFDKLVRAAIQSVRRNRKRSKLAVKGSSDHDPKSDDNSSTSSPVIANSTLASQAATPFNPTVRSISATSLPSLPSLASPSSDRISITSLVSPPLTKTEVSVSNTSYNGSAHAAQNQLPSLAKVFPWPEPSAPVPSLAFIGSHSHSPTNRSFLVSLETLCSFISRVGSGSAKYSYGNLQDEETLSNREFLGYSALKASIAACIERVVPSGQMTDSTTQARFGAVRKVFLSPQVVSALATSVGLHASSNLVTVLGTCCMEFGFDPPISCLKNAFYELLMLNPSLDYNSPDVGDKLAILFPMYSGHVSDRYPPSAPTTASVSISIPTKPRIRPVLLRFMDQRLDLTYQPGESGPPTMSEVLDSARQAFQLSDKRVLLIRDVNRSGKLIETDGEVSDAFGGAKIDLELTYPTNPPRYVANNGPLKLA